MAPVIPLISFGQSWRFASSVHDAVYPLKNNFSPEELKKIMESKFKGEDQGTAVSTPRMVLQDIKIFVNGIRKYF